MIFLLSCSNQSVNSRLGLLLVPRRHGHQNGRKESSMSSRNIHGGRPTSFKHINGRVLLASCRILELLRVCKSAFEELSKRTKMSKALHIDKRTTASAGARALDMSLTVFDDGLKDPLAFETSLVMQLQQFTISVNNRKLPCAAGLLVCKCVLIALPGRQH